MPVATATLVHHKLVMTDDNVTSLKFISNFNYVVCGKHNPGIFPSSVTNYGYEMSNLIC